MYIYISIYILIYTSIYTNFTGKKQHVRRHLEIHEGLGSFISHTKCGQKIGFLVSITDWF